MMIKKSIVIVLVILFLTMGFVGEVYAQKSVAKLLGARMILRLDQCEEIRKSITVINDNDIAMEIELSTSGDLMEGIQLEEESFRLEPGEERVAYFNVIAPEVAGLIEGKVNVKYTPDREEENAVGLASTIIVIASEDSVCKKSGGGTMIISGVVLIVILIGLVVFASSAKRKKKGSRSPRA